MRYLQAIWWIWVDPYKVTPETELTRHTLWFLLMWLPLLIPCVALITGEMPPNRQTAWPMWQLGLAVGFAMVIVVGIIVGQADIDHTPKVEEPRSEYETFAITIFAAVITVALGLLLIVMPVIVIYGLLSSVRIAPEYLWGLSGVILLGIICGSSLVTTAINETQIAITGLTVITLSGGALLYFEQNLQHVALSACVGIILIPLMLATTMVFATRKHLARWVMLGLTVAFNGVIIWFAFFDGWRLFTPQ